MHYKQKLSESVYLRQAHTSIVAYECIDQTFPGGSRFSSRSPPKFYCLFFGAIVNISRKFHQDQSIAF